MTDRVIKLVDVHATACFACDDDVTMAEVQAFVERAISAALDVHAELADWGGGAQRFYYNGPCAVDPRAD